MKGCLSLKKARNRSPSLVVKKRKPSIGHTLPQKSSISEFQEMKAFLFRVRCGFADRFGHRVENTNSGPLHAEKIDGMTMILR